MQPDFSFARQKCAQTNVLYFPVLLQLFLPSQPRDDIVKNDCKYFLKGPQPLFHLIEKHCQSIVNAPVNMSSSTMLTINMLFTFYSFLFKLKISRRRFILSACISSCRCVFASRRSSLLLSLSALRFARRSSNSFIFSKKACICSSRAEFGRFFLHQGRPLAQRSWMQCLMLTGLNRLAGWIRLMIVDVSFSTPLHLHHVPLLVLCCHPAT